MKNKFLLVFFVFTSTVFGQTTIDKYVSVNFPGEPERIDTTTKDQKLSIYILDTDSEVYMVMKAVMDLGDENNHVADTKELDERYQGSLKGQNKKMKQTGLALLDSNKIDIDGHIAYKMLYGIDGTNEPYTETVSLILNRTLYTFSYVGNTGFSKSKSSNFLNSVTIRNAKRPRIHTDQNEEKMGELIGTGLGMLLTVAFVVIVIRLIIRANKKKSSR